MTDGWIPELWLAENEIITAETATGLNIEELRRRLRARLRIAANRIKDFGLDPEKNRIIAIQTIRLFNLMDWKCAYCGVKLDLSLISKRGILPNKLTIDHIKPLTRRGMHTIDNVTCSCDQCNNSKAGLSIELFLNSSKKVKNFYERREQVMNDYYNLPEVFRDENR